MIKTPTEYSALETKLNLLAIKSLVWKFIILID